MRQVWTDAPGPVTPESAFYDSTVEQYALQPIEILSLRQMLEFGRAALYNNSFVLDSACRVQRELPKRLARRLMDLQFLPYIVVTNPHIKRVYDSYQHAFETLHNLPQVRTVEQNAEFTVLLKRLVDEHAPMLDALAAGLRECNSKAFVGPKLQLNSFLENMLTSRISRRVLAEQHINLHNRRPGYIGVICTHLNLCDAVDFAVQRATQVSRETYGVAPEVTCTGDLQSTIPYIPTHLDYMLYELLKNAMRAVVESHRDGLRPPAIHIRVCEADTDVTFRISDQGGGILADDLSKVWQYGYTTINHQDSSTFSGTSDTNPAWGAESGAQYRMGGLGFGLPMSRLYAEYFGGRLQLVSMPGYGIDAYLNLKRLEGDWQEQHAEPAAPLLTASGDDTRWNAR
ncbi:hypothetical protein WJX79_003750 [Trebouxia sp. C0005]